MGRTSKKSISNPSKYKLLENGTDSAAISISLIVISIIVTSFVITFSVYNYIGVQNIKALESGLIGFEGRKGPPGLNTTQNDSLIQGAFTVATTIGSRISTFDFCQGSICSQLDTLSQNLTELFNESGLMEVDLNAEIVMLRNLKQIVTNNTFCPQEICIDVRDFVQQFAPLVNNGSGNSGLTNRTHVLFTLLTNGTFVSYPVDNSDLSNGTISLYKINGLNSNQVIITPSDSILQAIPYLQASKGGTFTNSSNSTGFAIETSGTISFSPLLFYSYINIAGILTETQFVSDIQINRSKVIAGSASSVVINSGSGILSTETYLSTSRGGFGVSGAAFGGYVFWSSGSASIVGAGSIPRTVLNAGTPDHVVINNATGVLSSEAQLAKSRGGTAQNSSDWNGHVKVNESGIWGVTAALYLSSSDINTTNALNDSYVNSNAALSRSKISAVNASHVVINDASGYLSSEALLANSRGGTNKDSSSFTGMAKINSGNITASPLVYSNVDFTGTLVNSDFSSSAAIARSKVAATTINKVIINDVNGLLSNEGLTLQSSRGGTGADGSAWTGYVSKTNAVSFFSVTGTISYTNNLNLTNALVNGDFATNANIARSKIASGSNNHVIINDGSGLLSSEAQLATSRGGTGQDFSASTGLPKIVSGVWSVSTYTGSSSYSPILTFGNLSTGIVQSVTRGRYTRIINVVMVEIYIILSSKGTATGSARITLPITVAGTGTQSGAVAVLSGGTDLPATYYSVSVLPDPGTTSVILTFSGDNVARLTVTDAHFSASSSIQTSFTYFA